MGHARTRRHIVQACTPMLHPTAWFHGGDGRAADGLRRTPRGPHRLHALAARDIAPFDARLAAEFIDGSHARYGATQAVVNLDWPSDGDRALTRTVHTEGSAWHPAVTRTAKRHR